VLAVRGSRGQPQTGQGQESGQVLSFSTLLTMAS
jgi:hypothetical protein